MHMYKIPIKSCLFIAKRTGCPRYFTSAKVVHYNDLFSSDAYKNRLLVVDKNQYVDNHSKNKVVQNVKIDASLSSLDDRKFLDVLKKTFLKNSCAVDARTATLLKNECLSRLSTFDNVSMFYCADILNQSNFYFNDFVSAMTKTLMFKWDKIILGKEDALLFAHFLTIGRSVPTMIPVMDRIEKYFRENMTNLTTREVGFMCNLFFSTNNRMKDFNTLEGLKSYLLNVVSRGNNIWFTDLNNIIKVFRHANYINVPFFTKLGDSLCDEYLNETRSYVHLSNLAFTYSSLHIEHKRLLNRVTTIFCNKIVKGKGNKNIPSDGPRLKDLSRLLWSMVTFCLEVPDVLQQELFGCLRSNSNQIFNFPEIFVESLVASAINNNYDPHLLKLLLSPQFLQFKEGRKLEQRYQLVMLKSASSIEGNTNLVKECLRSEVGGDLRSEVGGDLRSEVGGDLRSEVGGDLRMELLTRRGLFSLIETLHDLLGGWSLFKHHFILDFSRITDIELRLDKEGNLISINPNFQESERLFRTIRPKKHCKETSIISAVLSNRSVFLNQNNSTKYEQIHLKHNTEFPKKVCIKVLGSNQFAQNSATLLGQHQLELRLLHKCGYEVFVVDPRTAYNFETLSKEERLQVVSDILSKLNIQFKRKKELNT